MGPREVLHGARDWLPAINFLAFVLAIPAGLALRNRGLSQKQILIVSALIVVGYYGAWYLVLRQVLIHRQ